MSSDLLESPGFGGSCFPKDTEALIYIARQVGFDLRIVPATIKVNERQKQSMIERIEAAVGDLRGKTIGILGLAFKPNTDDIRYTRALPIFEALVEKGASVKCYDPKAMENFKKLTDKQITFANSAKEAITNTELCIIQSDWQEFKDLTAEDFKKLMKTPIVIDGRRTFKPEELISEGVVYKGIGWKN